MRLAALFAAIIFASFLYAQAGSPGGAPGNSNRNMAELWGMLQPRRSYLGVKLADIDADRARELKLPEAEGVEVTEVENGSPAEKAGIRAGDVLLAYNGENILGAEHLARLVSETPPGRHIKIRLSRDGHEETLTVTPAAPDAAAEFPHGFPSMSPELYNFNLGVPDMPSPLLLWKTSIGIECEPLDSQLAQYFGVSHGVLVRSVEESSSAGKAGVHAGDVVTEFGQRSVSTPKDITAVLRVRRAGKAIPVTLVRDHREVHLSIKPSANREE
jgi:serine protease Do